MSSEIVELSWKHPPGEPRSKRAMWLILAPVAVVVAYVPTFVSLAVSYTGADSYYAHWFLIPPVAAMLVWLKKDRLRELLVQGYGLGIPLAIASLLFHALAVWFRVDFVSAFSLVVTVFGLALYLFGKRIVREIGFPLFFLVFMVPLPELVIGPLAFHMKILCAKLAVFLYGLFGGTAVLTGSSVSFAESEPLWMGYECSGLRSLIAMAALGAAFAHLVRASQLRKVLLFLLSIPFALLSNGVRVTSLCFAANQWGVRSKAFKIFHDASSPVVFLLVLAGLFGVHKLLLFGGRKKAVEPQQTGAAEAPSRSAAVLSAIPRRRLVAVFGFAAVTAVLVFLAPHSLSLARWMSSLKPVELPERIDGWQKIGSEVIASEGVWAILNTKSIVLGAYRDERGREVQVLIVASDTHRDAFHPPEICMMGAGSEIVKSWKEPIDVSSGVAEELHLNAFLLRGRDQPDTLVFYWFMVGEKSMGSRLVQQLILLLNGATRVPISGSMIRVTAPLEGMTSAEALDAAKALTRSLIPLMPRVLETVRRKEFQKAL